MTSAQPPGLPGPPGPTIDPNELFLPAGLTVQAWTSELTNLTLHAKAMVESQNRFLRAYAVKGSVAAAAAIAQIAYGLPYYWLDVKSHHFPERLAVAALKFRDHLQDMMMERLEEPGGNRGSDVLLMFALNAHWPEKYRRDKVILGSDVATSLLDVLRELARHPQPRVIEGEIVTQGPEDGKEIITKLLNKGSSTSSELPQP